MGNQLMASSLPTCQPVPTPPSNWQQTMASNASVNHKGYGTAAWIIYSRWNLWFGKGIAPGPMMGMYSRLAEAYWVHTGFSFANCGSNKQWSKTSLFAYQARKCSCGFTKRSHISLRQWLRPFVVLGWEQYLTGTASWILQPRVAVSFKNAITCMNINVNIRW